MFFTVKCIKHKPYPIDCFVKIDTGACKNTVGYEYISHRSMSTGYNKPTYLHIIWRWLVAGPLEGLCHVAKDLHRRQQVTSIEVPPLSEVQQVFCDLGHPIPRQHPLALSKVPLNLQKQEKTELGASVSSAHLEDMHSATHLEQMVWENSGRKTPLSEALSVTLMSKPGRNAFCLTDVLKWANMNKRVNWSRRHTFRQKLHSEMTFHIIAPGLCP